MSVKSPCSRQKIHVGKHRIILTLSLQSKQESKYDKVKSSKSLSPVGTTFRSCLVHFEPSRTCASCQKSRQNAKGWGVIYLPQANRVNL